MGRASVADASHQHGHVGTLAAPVRVQFVEDEELQPLGGSHESPLVDTRDDELSHHVVGQKDVRWALDDVSPDLGLVLPRVALEGHRRSSSWEADLQELPQLVLLAVGQCVHRVDNDGFDAIAAALAEHAVHNGDDVGEALARAGARSDHVVVAAGGGFNRFGLVAVQSQRPHQGIRVRLDAKDLAARRLENPLVDQGVDSASGLKARVERDPRFRPEHPPIELGADKGV